MVPKTVLQLHGRKSFFANLQAKRLVTKMKDGEAMSTGRGSTLRSAGDGRTEVQSRRGGGAGEGEEGKEPGLMTF